MEYLAEHPVHSQGLRVWGRCSSCGHYTELMSGYYCRCGYDGWSACHCTAEVVKPVPKSAEVRPYHHYIAQVA